ncbi:hypothetical protein NECID01_1296 [Nematocida sp. AWRm77]|nr:hypothetical protein NECID01_1296 [Nematocida sp. AWRm77]
MDSHGKRPDTTSEDGRREKVQYQAGYKEGAGHPSKKSVYATKGYKRHEENRHEKKGSEEEEQSFSAGPDGFFSSRPKKVYTLMYNGQELTQEIVIEELKRNGVDVSVLKAAKPAGASRLREAGRAEGVSEERERGEREHVPYSHSAKGGDRAEKEGSDAQRGQDRALGEAGSIPRGHALHSQESADEEARDRKPSRYAKPGKFQKGERPERLERLDRADRAERPERGFKAPRADKPGRRPERSDLERTDRADRADRSEKVEKADRADRADRAEKVEKVEEKEEEIPSEPIDLSGYGIVNGVPTKSTQKEATIWDIIPTDALRQAVFSKETAAAKPAKKAPKLKKETSTSSTEKDEADLNTSADSALGVCDASGAEQQEEREKEILLGESSAEGVVGEHIVEVPESFLEQPSVEEQAQTPAEEEQAPAPAEPSLVDSAPLSEGVPAPAKEKEPETKKASTEYVLPKVYRKEDLMSFRESAKKVEFTLDKMIFEKQHPAFGRKRREFKTLKFGSPAPGKKSVPVSVFATIEEYIANFNMALNQLSAANINEVADKLMKITVPTNESMKGLAQMFYERAVQEEAHVDLYAKLVEMIQKQFRSQEEEPYNAEEYQKEKDMGKKEGAPKHKSVFAVELTNLIRNEFMSKKTWVTNESDTLKTSMTTEELTARVLEISSNKEQEYARIATKKRALALTRFLGSLFLYGFFSLNLIHKAIKQVIQTPSPENVERICYLLKHTGNVLEAPGEESAKYLNGYINWLESASETLGSRFLFMVEELKDLSKAGWNQEKARMPAEEEHDDSWRSAKSRDRKKAMGGKDKDKPFARKWEESKEKDKGKATTLLEKIETHKQEYQRLESLCTAILKTKEAPLDEAKKLESQCSNPIFLAAFIKLLIEGYGEVIATGTAIIEEWSKTVPSLDQKTKEVFEYLDFIMDDLRDDTPMAPKILERVKGIVQNK